MKKTILSSFIVFVMFSNSIVLAAEANSFPQQISEAHVSELREAAYDAYITQLAEQETIRQAISDKRTILEKTISTVKKGVLAILGKGEGPIYVNAEAQEAAIRGEIDAKLLNLHSESLELKHSSNPRDKAMYQEVHEKLFKLWVSYEERTRIRSLNDRITNLKLLNNSLAEIDTSLKNLIADAKVDAEKAKDSIERKKPAGKTTGQISDRSRTSPGAVEESERILKINMQDLLKQLEILPEQRADIPKKQKLLELQLPFDPKDEKSVKEYVKLKSESKLEVVSLNQDGNLVVLRETTTGKLFVIPKEKVETIAKQSPTSLRATHGKALMDGIKGSAAHFIPEAFVFYTAVGANHILNLMINYENNPMALEQFIKELQDPVAMAGFYAFMVGNRYAQTMMSQAIQNHLAGKSDFTKGMTNRFLGFSAMAMGAVFSGLTHDVLAIAGPCMKSFGKIKGSKDYEETQMACENAYTSFATRDTAARYLSSMTTAVASAIGSWMATELMAGTARATSEVLLTGSVSGKGFLDKSLKIDRILVQIGGFFKDKVLMRPFSAIGKFGFKVGNIGIFLLADQMMNPYIHYGVESSLFTGPALQDARAGVEEIRKAFEDKQWDKLDCENLKNKVKDGMSPEGLAYRIGTGSGPLSMFSRFVGGKDKADVEKELNETCNVPKAILAYADESKRWREILLYKFNMRHSSWANFITEFTHMAKMANNVQMELVSHVDGKNRVDNILKNNPLLAAEIKRNEWMGKFVHMNLTRGYITTPDTAKTTTKSATRTLVYKGAPYIILLEQEESGRRAYNPLTEDNPLNGVKMSDMANNSEGKLEDNEAQDYRFLNTLKAAAVIESLVELERYKDQIINPLSTSDKDYVKGKLVEFEKQVDIFVQENLVDMTFDSQDVFDLDTGEVKKQLTKSLNTKVTESVTKKRIIALKPLANYVPLANALKALNAAYSYLHRRYQQEKRTSATDEMDIKTHNYKNYYFDALLNSLHTINKVRLFIGQPRPLEKGHAFFVQKNEAFKAEYKESYDLFLEHSLVRFFKERFSSTKNATAMDFIIRQSVCGPSATDTIYNAGKRRGDLVYDNLANNHINKVSSGMNSLLSLFKPAFDSKQNGYGTAMAMAHGQYNNDVNYFNENFEIENFWNYGTGIDFVIPKIVSGNHEELCKADYPIRPSKTAKFKYKDGKTYNSLFDFLIQNIDESLFSRYYSSNPVDFTKQYWESVVKPKIEQVYSEMDKDYTQLLLKDFFPVMDNGASISTNTPKEMLEKLRSDSRTWFQDNPSSLASSYLEELDTYLNFLEKLYVSLVENDQINFGLTPIVPFGTVGENMQFESQEEADFYNEAPLKLGRLLDSGLGLYESISKQSSNSLRMRLAKYFNPQDQVKIQYYNAMKKLSIASFKKRISNFRSYSSGILISYRDKGAQSEKLWAYAAAELNVILGTFQLDKDDIRYHVEMLKANAQFHKPEIASTPTAELIDNGKERLGIKPHYESYLNQMGVRFATSENYILENVFSKNLENQRTKGKSKTNNANSEVPEFKESLAENLNKLAVATQNGFQIKPLPVRLDRLVEPLTLNQGSVSGNVERKIEILNRYQDHAQTAFVTTYALFGLLEEMYSRIVLVKAASSDQIYEAIKFPEKPKSGGANPFAY